MKINSVEFVRSAPDQATMPSDGKPEIAFVGRSNVGKSSLLNALVGRKKLAHTSSTPGKTRAVNYFLVNGPGGFYLVDLPGFGYAKAPRQQRSEWQRLIGSYVTEREELRVLFQLIDSRHEPTRLDNELLELLRGSPVARVILLTKADKLSKTAQQQRVAQVRKHLADVGLELPVVLTSAEKKIGVAEVWQWADRLLQP